jgi:pseudouridine-5'-phosphate glycosidase
MKDFLELSEQVIYAFESKKPVIALESTIISHGMPYPQNLEVAKMLEKIALENDVIPATIAIMNGKLKVGLSEKDLEILAKSKNVEKVSLRDISKVMVKKQIGATTVAATMYIAHLAGIHVFATGGIGGVHRDLGETLDISADMTAFANIPIIVVTAGAKAILDLKNTVEYLETLGVPLFGYKTDDFPAFYSSESGIKIEKINSLEEIADIYTTNKKIGLKTGIIVANPVPKKFEIKKQKMEKIINRALKEAKSIGIKGKKITPFLLAKIVELTQGDSLKTNIELVKNNVSVACEIAKNI